MMMMMIMMSSGQVKHMLRHCFQRHTLEETEMLAREERLKHDGPHLLTNHRHTVGLR